jgi:NADPH-dependent curcumin reductase CurA
MSIPTHQTRIFLAERPQGPIVPGQTFKEETVPLPELQEGQVLVRVEHVSLDPAMRGWVNDARSYIPPVQIGETMRANAVGVVIKGGKKLSVGDHVTGFLGWTDYAVLEEKNLTKLHVDDRIKSIDYLGPLGGVGMTAYFGLFDIGQIKAGETLVVSGAAGAVGSYVVQLGKIKGAKVIAIAGTDEKCRWLEEDLGADKAINYKSPDFKKEFIEAVDYFDVYFDNVGGDILDFCLTRMKPFARIAICGAISQYNAAQAKGLQNYLTLIAMRAKIQGFIVLDYVSRFPEARKEMIQWLAEGKIKTRYQVEKGLSNCPEHLGLLFTGGNTGKLVVQIAEDNASKL